MSIGKLGVEENKKHAAVLHDHIEKNLGIPRNRLYITFIDEDAANVGYNGTTFHEIFGGKWKENDDADAGCAAWCCWMTLLLVGPFDFAMKSWNYIYAIV